VCVTQLKRWLRGDRGGKASTTNLGVQHTRYHREYLECLAELNRSRDSGVFAMTPHVEVASSSEQANRAQTAGLAADPVNNLPELGRPDDVV
jgi:hypothetical protein